MASWLRHWPQALTAFASCLGSPRRTSKWSSNLFRGRIREAEVEPILTELGHDPKAVTEMVNPRTMIGNTDSVAEGHMFDDVLREIRRLEQGVQISIEMPLDEDGFFDRVCPNVLCTVDFKVLFEDWREKVSDEVVYCPICRFEAESGKWNTSEQQGYMEQAAAQYVEQELGRAFTTSARQFNRSQQSDSFIKMSMSYRPGLRPILMPIEASEIMNQQSKCDECGCQYSSIGAAFFCPACGHNSATSIFDAAVDTVRKTLGSLPTIRKALAEATDADAAEDSARQFVENGLVKLVASFQRLAEALFDGIPNRSQFTPRRNVFQNLSESSELWRSAIGSGYDDIISAAEFSDLGRFFQQRHLLSHKEGMVDQEYIDRSGDLGYAVDQRLVVRDKDVQELADLVSKLADEMRKRT